MQSKHLIILVISILLFSTACEADITSTVVDAESGQPIEGAVVLVEWTKTKGMPGMTFHEVYKIIEVESDKKGMATISEMLRPFLDPPDVVVYKKGYIVWRSDYIFPEWEKRKNFKLENGIVIKMQPLPAKYSKWEHYRFLTHGIIGSSLENTPKFYEITNEMLKDGLMGKEKKKDN